MKKYIIPVLLSFLIVKCRINGTELPMLYAIYEKSVAHGSSSESHLYFTYKGYTGNILIDNY